MSDRLPGLQVAAAAVQTQPASELPALELTVARALRSSLAATLQHTAGTLLTQRPALDASLLLQSSFEANGPGHAAAGAEQQPGGPDWTTLGSIAGSPGAALAADHLQAGLQSLAAWAVGACHHLKRAQQLQSSTASSLVSMQRLCQQQSAEVQRLRHQLHQQASLSRQQSSAQVC